MSLPSPLLEYFHHIVTEFPATLNSDGDLTADSIRLIVKALQDRDAKSLRHPAAPVADHALWLGAEEVNGRGWIHGEFVAFAAVVVAWHCEDDTETITGWLDVCKVRWRPGEIGVSRDESAQVSRICSHLHVRRHPRKRHALELAGPSRSLALASMRCGSSSRRHRGLSMGDLRNGEVAVRGSRRIIP